MTSPSPNRAALFDLATKVSSSALSDRISARFRHPYVITGLTTPTPDRVLFGPAATIDFLPFRDDLHASPTYDFARMYYAAVGDEPQGRVLVMSNAGMPHAALAGGKKLSRAAFQGVAGALADGCFRDLHELADLGLALYCRGEAVANANGVIAPVAAGVPVVVGGVTVAPGDYVFADRAGAVVIPASAVEEVMREAAELEQADVATIDASRDVAADRARHTAPTPP